MQGACDISRVFPAPRIGLPTKHTLTEWTSALSSGRDSLQLTIWKGGMEEKGGKQALDAVEGTWGCPLGGMQGNEGLLRIPGSLV